CIMSFIEQNISEYQLVRQRRVSLSNELTNARRELEYLSKDRTGFVYFLRSPKGLYKIGRTKSIDARVFNLRNVTKENLEMKQCISTDDMHLLEACAHFAFREFRIDGEWFAMDENDTRFLEWTAPDNRHYVFNRERDRIMAVQRVKILANEMAQLKELLGERIN